MQDYAAIFLAGGHGTMWDFPDHPVLGRLVGEALATNRLVGAVCHGPAGLLGARTPDGALVIDGMDAPTGITSVGNLVYVADRAGIHEIDVSQPC